MGARAGQGTLGSARADRAMQSALADQSMAFNQARQQAALGGAQQLMGLGQQAATAQTTGQGMQALGIEGLGKVAQADVQAEQIRRDAEQQGLDAPYTAASKYFGLLNQAPQGQTQTTRGK